MIVWWARSHEQTGIQGKSREWSDPIAEITRIGVLEWRVVWKARTRTTMSLLVASKSKSLGNWGNTKGLHQLVEVIFLEKMYIAGVQEWKPYLDQIWWRLKIRERYIILARDKAGSRHVIMSRFLKDSFFMIMARVRSELGTLLCWIMNLEVSQSSFRW